RDERDEHAEDLQREERMLLRRRGRRNLFDERPDLALAAFSLNDDLLRVRKLRRLDLGDARRIAARLLELPGDRMRADVYRHEPRADDDDSDDPADDRHRNARPLVRRIATEQHEQL